MPYKITITVEQQEAVQVEKQECKTPDLYSSPIIDELVSEITPEEFQKTAEEMKAMLKEQPHQEIFQCSECGELKADESGSRCEDCLDKSILEEAKQKAQQEQTVEEKDWELNERVRNVFCGLTEYILDPGIYCRYMDNIEKLAKEHATQKLNEYKQHQADLIDRQELIKVVNELRVTKESYTDKGQSYSYGVTDTINNIILLIKNQPKK